jgi:glycerol-3-phosphate acyltransferase PlsX
MEEDEKLSSDMNRSRVRIALDAMGGDYVPRETVGGAVMAAREGGVEVILVGPEDVLKGELEKHQIEGLPIRQIASERGIREDESPVTALRQNPQSSIAVATRLVKTGEADAVVSMGSTGATMASAVMILETMEGIKRPLVGGVFLGFTPKTMVFDMGASVDCKPRQLLSFATMGSIAARKVLGIAQPTVALLSTGTEKGKGNRAVKEAYQLLEKSNLNFIGNVEGIDVPLGRANVIICDGFVGNILIKFCEGMGECIAQRLRDSLRDRLPPSDIEDIATDIISQTSTPDVEGGGLLYGVNGVVVVGHGRFRAPEIAKCIHQAEKVVRSGLIDALRSELAEIEA